MTDATGGGTQTPTPGGAGAGGTGGTATPWYQGVEGVTPEMVGHWQTKGWHTLKPEQVAVQASQAWKEAERHVGVPADEIVRLSKTPTPEQLTGLHTRLGRPADAAKYDLSAVKLPDGTDLDDGFSGMIRNIGFKLGLPQQGLVDLASEIVKFVSNADAADAAEIAGNVANEKATLAKNWGANAAQNLLVAQNAVRALGWDQEVVAGLEKVVGYAKIMEALRNVGARLGEDRFVTGGANGTGANGVMSRDQAIARKAELKADRAWVTKFLANDREARREMAALDTIISAA